jgi:hypothetical protein
MGATGADEFHAGCGQLLAKLNDAGLIVDAD